MYQTNHVTIKTH